MRLLRCSTLEFEEFMGDDFPAFAILSHRWSNDEVSLKDMIDGTASGKAGYAKIKRCCDRALEDGLQYAWVDTCCIDKTSSAELSEAINSMYQWYQDASICYAYLADVQAGDEPEGEAFAGSAWFTRGWTLQELVAPTNVEFYNHDWHKLGTRDTLKDIISNITNIDTAMLEGADPGEFSVAKRMSWASKRTTTKPEDRAYSLLGLFKVNMPMLYGEGNRAFVRLQEEIMKNSDDQTIFAWTKTNTKASGLLAESPADFEGCHNIVSASVPWSRRPYSITNKGLSMQLPMTAWALETYLVALDCEVENVPDSRIGIFLRLKEERDQYARVLIDGKGVDTYKQEMVSRVQYKDIYVRQQQPASYQLEDQFYGFWIRTLPAPLKTVSDGVDASSDESLSEVAALSKWSDEERILEMPLGSTGTAGSIYYKMGSRSTVLKLGFDLNFNPICQFGGNLYSPVKPPTDPRSVEAQMDPSWMTIGRSDYLHVGDRLSGYRNSDYAYSMCITRERVGDRNMWVVDIWDQSQTPSSYICDGCGQVSLDFIRLSLTRSPRQATDHYLPGHHWKSI